MSNISNDPNAPMKGAVPPPVSNWDLIKEEFRGHYEQSEPQKYHLALRGIEMIQSGIAELAKLGHSWVASEVWNNKVETNKLMDAERAKVEAKKKADEEAKKKAFEDGQAQAQAQADKAAQDRVKAEEEAKARTAAANKVQPGSQTGQADSAGAGASKKG